MAPKKKKQPTKAKSPFSERTQALAEYKDDPARLRSFEEYEPAVGQGATGREGIYKNLLADPESRLLIDEGARLRAIERRNQLRRFAGLPEVSTSTRPDMAFLMEQQGILNDDIQALLDIQKDLDTGEATNSYERYKLAMGLLEALYNGQVNMENTAMTADAAIQVAKEGTNKEMLKYEIEAYKTFDLTGAAAKAYNEIEPAMVGLQSASRGVDGNVNLAEPGNQTAMSTFLSIANKSMQGLAGDSDGQAALAYHLNAESVARYGVPLVGAGGLMEHSRKAGGNFDRETGLANSHDELTGILNSAFTSAGATLASAERAKLEAAKAAARVTGVGHEDVTEAGAKAALTFAGIDFSMPMLTSDPDNIDAAYEALGIIPPESVASGEIQRELTELQGQREEVQTAMQLRGIESSDEAMAELAQLPGYQDARLQAYEQGLFQRGEQGLQAQLMNQSRAAERGGADPLLDRASRERQAGERHQRVHAKQQAAEEKRKRNLAAVAGSTPPAAAADRVAPLATPLDRTPVGGQTLTPGMQLPYNIGEAGRRYLQEQLFRQQDRFDPVRIAPPKQ